MHRLINPTLVMSGMLNPAQSQVQSIFKKILIKDIINIIGSLSLIITFLFIIKRSWDRKYYTPENKYNYKYQYI